ncbi:MAG: TIGR03086 family metal-binding protein [Acidimicrobiales bacterium]
MDVLELHQRALAEARRVIDGVTLDDFPTPTPCADWDVRALLNHIVSGNWLFAAIATGKEPPDASGDYIGNDPVGAFARSASVVHGAFTAPPFAAATFPPPAGESPAPALVHTAELATHAWDLVRATGQPVTLDEELCDAALEIVRRGMEGRTREAGGPFEPEQPVAGDAPAGDRLAAFLGRTI